MESSESLLPEPISLSFFHSGSQKESSRSDSLSNDDSSWHSLGLLTFRWREHDVSLVLDPDGVIFSSVGVSLGSSVTEEGSARFGSL